MCLLLFYLKYLSIFLLVSKDACESGSLHFPQSKPICSIAYFTGTGLTSQNNRSINSISLHCRFAAVSKSPASAALVIASVSVGQRLDRTDMTPNPPKAIDGTIWSSLPAHTYRSLPHAAWILACFVISWLASFTPMMFGICESRLYTEMGISTPVREGTLYRMMGISTDPAMDAKCA